MSATIKGTYAATIRTLQKKNRGIREYTEKWFIAPDGTGSPGYSVGDAISPTIGGESPSGLIWFNIQLDTHSLGPFVGYVASA